MGYWYQKIETIRNQKGKMWMANQFAGTLRSAWMLVRAIAVISSSIATIVSTMLPLFLYSSLSASYLTAIFILLAIGAFLIHGLLTHAFNDYADYLSGTDEHSPAILSGGSRVLQTNAMSLKSLWLVGKWLTIALMGIAVLCFILGYIKVGVLLLIGVWAAASYSLPPLSLSYKPFLGEWLSLFPSIFLLGLGGAWLALGTIPEWALQNAFINAMICLAWVMVHHIPDREADMQASPEKRTTVVWFTRKFGSPYAHMPAVCYLVISGLTIFWLGSDRLLAAAGLAVLMAVSLILVSRMDNSNPEHVSAVEKTLLLIAMISAGWLGIFI